MTLEPTATQLAEIREAMYLAGDVASIEVARAAFTLVRDMVLEEAAKRCERPQSEDDWVPAMCQENADAIRAMKGLKHA